MNWFISITETLWQCVSVRVPPCTRSFRTCHGVDVSTLQVDPRPRSVLLQLDVGMKEACQTDDCILDCVGQSLIIFKLDLQVNLAYKILINLLVFHRMKYFVWLGFFRKCKSRSGQNWVTASPSWPRVLSLCLNTPPVPPSVCPTSPVWGAWCRHPPTR